MSVPEQGRFRSSFAAFRHRAPGASVDSGARPGNGLRMNKRLAMLEKLTASAQADSFAFYCLGMEYRKEARIDEALGAFGTLRDKDPGYLAMYLMAGQMLREGARLPEAATWLKQGIELAKQKNDSKALGELESELSTVETG